MVWVYKNNLEFAEASRGSDEALNYYKSITAGHLAQQLERYVRMSVEGKFPFLWPLSSNSLGFDFVENLDDFDNAKNHYCLGNDGTGDWFVISKDEGKQIYLCDQSDYGLYDGWPSLNNLLAWAVRLVLIDENKVEKSELLSHWKNSSNKLDQASFERLLDEVEG